MGSYYGRLGRMVPKIGVKKYTLIKRGSITKELEQIKTVVTEMPASKQPSNSASVETVGNAATRDNLSAAAARVAP